MKMGKLNMNNLLPPGVKPTTDQSNKKKLATLYLLCIIKALPALHAKCHYTCKNTVLGTTGAAAARRGGNPPNYLGVSGA